MLLIIVKTSNTAGDLVNVIHTASNTDIGMVAMKIFGATESFLNSFAKGSKMYSAIAKASRITFMINIRDAKMIGAAEVGKMANKDKPQSIE